MTQRKSESVVPSDIISSLQPTDHTHWQPLLQKLFVEYGDATGSMDAKRLCELLSASGKAFDTVKYSVVLVLAYKQHWLWLLWYGGVFDYT